MAWISSGEAVLTAFCAAIRSLRSRCAEATTAAASAFTDGEVATDLPGVGICAGCVSTDARPAMLLFSLLLMSACNSSGDFAFFAASWAFVRSSKSFRAAATIVAASALIAA